jgi:hypothetical protein
MPRHRDNALGIGSFDLAIEAIREKLRLLGRE